MLTLPGSACSAWSKASLASFGLRSKCAALVAKGGALINVLSVASWINGPMLATYGASKSAAWALAKNAGFPRKVALIQDAYGVPVYAVPIRDQWIENPRRSACGRFAVDPEQHHGLRAEEIAALSEKEAATGDIVAQMLWRGARAKLLAHDRKRSGDLRVTHEVLAHMVGATRPRVSEAAARLRAAAAIDYQGGRLRIVSRPRLEQASCECYRATRSAC